MLINQVPNLNHYPVNPQNERFGFLPFVGGLAVGALAGGFGGGPRPCCGPMMQPQFFPVPIQTLPAQIPPQFIPVQTLPGQIPPQQFQPFQTVQGPVLESNKYFIR